MKMIYDTKLFVLSDCLMKAAGRLHKIGLKMIMAWGGGYENNSPLLKFIFLCYFHARWSRVGQNSVFVFDLSIYYKFIYLYLSITKV